MWEGYIYIYIYICILEIFQMGPMGPWARGGGRSVGRSGGRAVGGRAGGRAQPQLAFLSAMHRGGLSFDIYV